MSENSELEREMSDFWWRVMTGPRSFVDDIRDAIVSGKNVLVDAPCLLPWPGVFRKRVQDKVFEHFGNGNTMHVVEVDLEQFAETDYDPGAYLLKSYCYDDELRCSFRSGGSMPIHDYLSEYGALSDCFFWIRGFRSQKEAEAWLEFCTKFRRKEKGRLDVAFVMECNGREAFANKASDSGNLHVAKQMLLDYDLLFFNSHALGVRRKGLSPFQMEYESVLLSSVCSYDLPLALDAVENCPDCFSVETIRSFMKRNKKHGSGLLSDEEFYKMVWSAQVKVIFPKMEMARLKIVDKYRDDLEKAIADDALNIKRPVDDKRVENVEDLELGILQYIAMRSHYLVSDCKRDVKILYDCRNSLAHLGRCSDENIRLVAGVFARWL